MSEKVIFHGDFIYLPFYNSVQHRIFEVPLVHKGLITVARSVLWMSFSCVHHHCISTASIHVLKLVRRDKTLNKQETNKQATGHTRFNIKIVNKSKLCLLAVA